MWQSIKNVYHFGQAILANIAYGFPSRGLTIIGVTGTDGKTTTANLIYHVLVQSGKKAALISSNGAIMNGKASDIGFHVTTPGRFVMQSYLKKAKKIGIKYVILEVTSHALDQHRVTGIHFDVGVVTNISHEHLDYHKTYERYVAAKAKLLKKAKVAIVNKDDQSYKHLKKYLRHKHVITYGMKNDTQVNPHNFPFRIKLIGRFNEYNALATIAALQTLHISDVEIRSGLASFKAPEGRQEVLYKKDFMVINDFAHTPNSFSVMLPEIRKLATRRLIHVFGSAAKRDVYKRPEMGAISAKYSDVIVLTSEDPRDEPPEKISDEILSGITNDKFQILNYQDGQKIESGKKYIVKIFDRKEAIQFAVNAAQKGDVVLMTGKGHEKSMNYGHGEESWNENEAAREALRQRKLL